MKTRMKSSRSSQSGSGSNLREVSVDAPSMPADLPVVTRAGYMPSTVGRAYGIKGSSGHTHTVTLTCANLQLLKAGTAVTVTSSSGAGHTHEVRAVCS